MNGLEAILGLATEVSKLTMSICTSPQSAVLFRTRNLPWGWTKGTEVGTPYLDLRGPFGAKLFVTAETEEIMQELRRTQETLLGVHFPSITLCGRHGVGGGGSTNGYYVKWSSVPSRRPGTHVVFLFQSWQSPGEAEELFAQVVDCIEIVELLPRGR